MKKFLMKLARRIVEEVIQKVTAQLNIVQDQVINAMKQELNQLVGEGKGFWGPAAERHAAEISGKVVPELSRLAESITNINTNTRQAMDIVEAADKNAKARIEELASRFRAVYSR